jgi:exopolysaccharide biosynthesis protein
VAPGCAPPDLLPVQSEGLPERSLAYLRPDRVITFQIEEGVVYRSVRSGEEPWNLHLIEVDASRCDLGFRVVRAEGDEGRASVLEMARRSEPGVIAAVNGDFFTPEDLPLGVEVADGKLRNRTSRPVFAWKPGEVPWVGAVEWEEGTLRLGSWSTTTEPESGVQVVAGFPALLAGGSVVGDLEMGERPDFAGERDPRTAIGFDSKRQRLWIAVVEGRREGVSEGMTLPELVELFRSLGVADAINFDGGGSSVMVIRGASVSRPSDPFGARPVVNALVLRQDSAYCSGRQ